MDWWKAPPARCSWTRSAGPGGNQQRTVRGGGLDAVHAIRGQVLRAGWREIAEGTQTGRADALLWDPARGPLARWTGRSCSAAKSKNARRRLQYGRPCRFACATPQVRRLARQRGATLPVIVPRAPAVRRPTPQRGFEPRISAPLAAPPRASCVPPPQACCDCPNDFWLPCIGPPNVDAYLGEECRQPCCCRNKQRAALRIWIRS
jgi:hypothetical protein